MSRYGVRVIKQRSKEVLKPVGSLPQSNATSQALMGVAQQASNIARTAFGEWRRQSITEAKDRAMSIPMDRLVTLNEDGNYNIYDSEEFITLGTAGQDAFRSLMDDRIFDHWESELDSAALKERVKYSLSPNGASLFRGSFGSFADSIIENLPSKYRGRIERYAINLTDKHGSDLDYQTIQRRHNANLESFEDKKKKWSTNFFEAIRTKDFELIDSIAESSIDSLINQSDKIEASNEKAKLSKLSEETRRWVEGVVGVGKINKMFDSTNMDRLDVSNVKLCLMYDTNCDHVPDDRGLKSMMEDIRSDLNGDNREMILSYLQGVSSAKNAQLVALNIDDTEGKAKQERLANKKVLDNFWDLVNGEEGFKYNENWFNVGELENILNNLTQTYMEDGKNLGAISRNNFQAAQSQVRLLVTNKLLPKLSNLNIEDSNQIGQIIEYLYSGLEKHLNQETTRSFDNKKIVLGEDEKRIIKDIRKRFLDPENATTFLGAANKNSIVQRFAQTKGLLNEEELELKASLKLLEQEDQKEAAVEQFFSVKRKNESVEMQIRSLLSEDKYDEAKILLEKQLAELEEVGKAKYSQITGPVALRYQDDLKSIFNDFAKDKVLSIISEKANAEVSTEMRDGKWVVNDKRLDGFQDLMDFIRSPSDKKLREKLPPEVVTILENSTIMESPKEISSYTTDINIRRNGYVESSTVTKAMAKKLDLRTAISNGTATPGADVSQEIDEIAYQLLKRDNPLMDTTKGHSQSLQDWWLSPNASNPNSKTFKHMYNNLQKGFFPESLANVIRKSGTASGEELKNLIKVINILTAFPTENGTRKDIWSLYSSSDAGVDHYLFSNSALVNRVEQLRSVLNVSSYLGLVDEMFILDPTMEQQVSNSGGIGHTELRFFDRPEVQNNLESVRDQIMSTSNSELKNSLNVLAKDLDLDSLSYGEETDNISFKTDRIIHAMLVDKGIIKGRSVAPREIIDMTKWMLKGMMLTGKDSSEIYEDTFKIVAQHVGNNFKESEGVIDFSNMGNFGVNLTRNNLSHHITSQKLYTASARMIDNNLPEGYHLHLGLLPSDVMKEIFPNELHNIGTQNEPVTENNWLLNSFVQARPGFAPSMGQVDESVRLENMRTTLEEDSIPVYLVAFPSPNNNPLWQTYALNPNGSFEPIKTKDNSAGLYTKNSLLAALSEEGIVDDTDRQLIEEAREARRRLGFPDVRIGP